MARCSTAATVLVIAITNSAHSSRSNQTPDAHGSQSVGFFLRLLRLPPPGQARR